MSRVKQFSSYTLVILSRFLRLSFADCLAGGEWSLGSRLPRCEAIICHAPAPPTHGSVHPQAPGPGQAQYRVGDIVKFHCDTGFMMSGERS